MTDAIPNGVPEAAPAFEKATFARVTARLIPLLFVCYIVAFLDRVNVGFAKLQMAGELGFSDAVYGFGAGVFFIGYFLFEVPSNLILARVGARVWMARIMVTWGLISCAFLFIPYMYWGGLAQMLGTRDTDLSFYVLRFALGAAEAGFFPGIILYMTYWFPAERRAGMVALFMTSISVANVIGSPVSGFIMQYFGRFEALSGWQWLFLIEGLPSVAMGFAVFAFLPNGPHDARWLTQHERDLIVARVAAEQAQKSKTGARHKLGEALKDWRLWALAVVYFCHNTCIYAVNFWMPTLIQEIGIDKTDLLRVGLLSMIPWGLAGACQVIWARHSDKTGERRWHAVAGLWLAMLGLIILALVGHAPIASMIGMSCVTVGIMSYVGIFWSLPTSFLSGTAAVGGIALINSIGNLGGHVGPDMVGRIRDASGGNSQAAFFVLAGAALTASLIIIRLPRPKKQASEA
jgi:MFS family permease